MQLTSSLTINTKRLIKTLCNKPLKIKIPGKNLCRQLCTEGFNSGVNGLKTNLPKNLQDEVHHRWKNHHV
jgi:hypothetical protein